MNETETVAPVAASGEAKYDKPLGHPLGDDRVLSIDDICELTGFCPAIASKLMKESGYAILIHRRVFILESNLLKYLKSLAVA